MMTSSTLPKVERSRYVAVAGLLWLVAGCGPTYPNCQTDDHCQAKGEYCLDGKCAQCRTDNQCPGADSDPCIMCAKGACERKADCCSTPSDCGPGKKCEANQCVPECAGDTDCAAGQTCVEGACRLVGAAAGSGCAADSDCGAGLRCSAGKCVDGAGECQLSSIYFGYDEYTLSAEARGTIEANQKCLKEKGITALLIEGHTDERGTDAYNMELGTRRAKTVRQYLSNLAPKVKTKSISYGKTRPTCTDDSEACWGRNRRAEFLPGK